MQPLEAYNDAVQFRLAEIINSCVYKDETGSTFMFGIYDVCLSDADGHGHGAFLIGVIEMLYIMQYIK